MLRVAASQAPGVPCLLSPGGGRGLKACPCSSADLQARGLKKHLKRLNAPRHWMLDKLGGAFVSDRHLPLSGARACCEAQGSSAHQLPAWPPSALRQSCVQGCRFSMVVCRGGSPFSVARWYASARFSRWQRGQPKRAHAIAPHALLRAGTQALPRAAQGARVPPPGHHPAQPPQVRADVPREQRHCDAAPHRGRREGPHRQVLPRRLHG